MLQLRIHLNRYLAFAALVSTLCVAFPALAETTGNIRGTIVDDEDGLPIPEVVVTVTSEQLIGGAQERLTGPDGGYKFVGLPPGQYSLTATKAGFQTITVEGIEVQVNHTFTQDLQLPLRGASGEVVVEGKKQTVDVTSTSRGEVLTKEFLQRIPSGRSYQSAVKMVAGVTPGSGGNVNMGGAATNENTYQLDGATITDPVTGTFSLNFNFDAIQQIDVLLGGYMPEQGVSLGGIQNVVTKSGSNNLEFNSAVFYDNSNWRPHMDARYTADGLTLAPTGFDTSFTKVEASALLSGPIVRDRAWFLLSYQYTRTLSRAVGLELPRDFDGHFVFGKLTVQPNAEHRLSAFLQMDPSVIDNLAQTQFVKAEAQERQTQGGYAANLRWQWFVSPEANVDTKLTLQKSFIEVGPVPCTHASSGYNPCAPGEAEGWEDWETPGRVGLYGAYDSVNFGAFYFDDRFRYDASTALSLLSVEDPFGGVHDLKAGVGAVQNVWSQIQGYSGNTLYYDLNEVPFDPNSFNNYYWLEITGPIKFSTSQSQWDAYIQDEWKPIKNVTIKGGVRYDNTVVRNDLGEPVIVGHMAGPRLYAAWDPFGKQKTKISGGFGRFNDTGRLGVASFTSQSGYGSKLFLGEYFRDGDTGFLNGSSLLYDLGPRENNNVAWGNLRTPRSDEAMLMFQQELVEDVVGTVTLTAKYTRNGYEQDDLNHIYDQDGSNVIGTRSGDYFYDSYRLRTPNLALRDYYQGDLNLRKVPSHRWSAALTYTYTQSVGTSPFALSGSFANNPESQYSYGRFATDLTHVVKGWGWWELPTDPWKQVLGVSVFYWSGEPVERLYYSENAQDYGSLRIRDRGIYTNLPPFWEFGLQIQQEIDVRKGKLVLQVSAENITNNRAPDGLSSLLYTQNRLLARSRQDPFRAQIGARYVF